MGKILDAIREHLAKGRILGGKSFNFGHESTYEMQSFVVHDRIPIEQYAHETFVGVNEKMEVVQMGKDRLAKKQAKAAEAGKGK
jgi:hypothetical protein